MSNTRRPRRSLLPILAVALLPFLGTGCDNNDSPPAPAGGGGGGNGGGGPSNPDDLYDVEITRTSLGIPHVRALREGDFGSAGYGYGYAHAQDNLCVLQADLITIRGERAKYFGRDGNHVIIPNDSVANNVDSDFFWKFMATDEAWQRLLDATEPDLRSVTTGFVDGWNRYIAEIKAGGHAGRHLDCRDEPWVQPIGEADMYRRYYRLALIASSSVFVSGIAQAQPPTPAVPGLSLPAAKSANDLAARLKRDPGPLKAFLPENRDRFGSNMYALSADATTNGQSMVFGNPHFPWTDTERLYISHVTVPGKMDMMGASLYGVPAILIGFNDHFAWSHTVSTAFRFTIYQLTLNPLNPTQYLYDDGPRDMEAVELSVEVKDEAEPETRTLYRTHYGPIIGLEVEGQNALPWTSTTAFAIRDANAENTRLINQFAEWNQATSLGEFIDLHKSILGIPWVNTVASGPNGKAYYGDVSVVPNVPNDMLVTCAAHPVHEAIQQVVPGLPVLNGATSACEWVVDETAPQPGIIPAASLPTLQRDDWVHNCNDSYWLSNPAEPLTGFPGIVGAYDGLAGSEEYARTLRTRLCMLQALRHLQQPGADELGTVFDANSDMKFDLQELQETVLSSQIYSGQIARDDVVANICPNGTVLSQSGPVDVTDACTVLSGWNLTANLSAVGTHVWREFFRGVDPIGLGPSEEFTWNTPFDAGDPVNTPRDLNTDSPAVQSALGDAVVAIEDAGHALDARFGTLQHPAFIDPAIEIFGGEGFEGAFTIANSGRIAEDGYGVEYGNSYIQTVTWTPDGAGFRPVAEGFVTYSQSTDPASPHFKDFTQQYSNKDWHRFPFRPAEIAADQISQIRLTQPAP